MTEQETKLQYPNPSTQMIAEGGCEGKCETCEGKKICWRDHFTAEQERLTKQENREKEGRKIWEIIKQCYSPVCYGCFDEEKGCFVCAADAVCDYMFSKIEEVSIEMKKEAMSFIKENRYCTIDDELIEEAYKRFGVEAEE